VGPRRRRSLQRPVAATPPEPRRKEWGAVAKGVASSVTAAMVGTKAGESERSGEGNNEGVAGVDLLHARWERRERGSGRREEAEGRGRQGFGDPFIQSKYNFSHPFPDGRCRKIGLFGFKWASYICSEHDPICHLFELILVIHANISDGTDHIV
jgi:hypothetical protein